MLSCRITGDSEEEAALVIDDEMEVSQSNQLSDNNEYVFIYVLSRVVHC